MLRCVKTCWVCCLGLSQWGVGLSALLGYCGASFVPGLVRYRVLDARRRGCCVHLAQESHLRARIAKSPTHRAFSFMWVHVGVGGKMVPCGGVGARARISSVGFWPLRGEGATAADLGHDIDATRRQDGTMCRNIRTLYNFEPPATDEEIQAAALQFVRKLSGSSRPSQANREAFDRAVSAVSDAARELVDSLVTHAPPKNRQEEAAKRKARSVQRFAKA